MVSAEEPGKILIEFGDLEENHLKEVTQFHTSLVSQATKSPVGVQVSALPSMPGTPYMGKRVIVSIKTDATDTIESEESDWTIPLSFVDEKTLRPAFTNDVKLASFTGFTPAGTVDIVCTAATKQRVAHYDAPQGYLLTLGAGRRYHVYIGDDTA